MSRAGSPGGGAKRGEGTGRREGARPGRGGEAGAAPQPYRAGCGREWALPSHEPDLAYTELVFPECPGCPHRVAPEGAGVSGMADFCTLRPARAPHPFAGLAALLDDPGLGE